MSLTLSSSSSLPSASLWRYLSVGDGDGGWEERVL
jgi:hypothetical protein